MSGPEEREALDIALLCDFLTDAATEGYNVLAVSGGEPLLYQQLRSLLTHARACGLLTTITTNGMLLDDRHLKRIEGVIDLIAISLDGIPESHNRMRASKHAFEKMYSRLENLRISGIPFGFIFTLTQYNLNELSWVAQFALEQGARLLQIHPLEEAGRAVEMLQGEFPDGLEVSFAYLEAMQVQAIAESKMRIQVDLVNRSLLRSTPERFYAELPSEDAEEQLLSDLVSPLVLETDGTVAPLLHGFSRNYVLGNLHEAPLRALAPRWRRSRLRGFTALCKSVLQQEATSNEEPFFNWYEAVARESRSSNVLILV